MVSNSGRERAVRGSPPATYISLEDSTVLRLGRLNSTITLPESLFSELTEETMFPKKKHLTDPVILSMRIIYYYKVYEAVKYFYKVL